LKPRLLLAIILNFFVLSACLAYDEWATYDEELIDINSGLTFELNNSIQGYGLVSTYQHIDSQKPDGQSSLDMSNAACGSGFYSYKSLVSSRADFDIDADSKEVTGVDAEINLKEEISASNEERSFRMGKSFESGPLKLPWKLDTRARNYVQGIAVRYLFDSITAIDHKSQLDQVTDALGANDTYLDLDSRFTGIGYLNLLYSPIQKSIHPPKPEFEFDEKYIGSFHLIKKIGANIEGSESEEEDIWLPCCDYGVLDAYESNLTFPGVDIFNCSCLSGR